jgi:hypothetical protein
MLCPVWCVVWACDIALPIRLLLLLTHGGDERLCVFGVLSRPRLTRKASRDRTESAPGAAAKTGHLQPVWCVVCVYDLALPIRMLLLLTHGGEQLLCVFGVLSRPRLIYRASETEQKARLSLVSC